MKMTGRLAINEWTKNDLSNTTFDCGGAPTYTTMSAYAQLKLRIKRKTEEIDGSDLVKKLNSLKDEPTLEYPNALDARSHIKRLMK